MRRYDRPGVTNEPGLAFDFADVVIVDPTADPAVIGAALAARAGGDHPLVVHRLDDRLALPQVAEFLNVGISFAVILVEKGVLPATGTGLSRRVPLAALAPFRIAFDRARSAAIKGMTAEAQALGLYDNPPASIPSTRED
jgi:hypothetical protein